jgi:hypothetical protein
VSIVWFSVVWLAVPSSLLLPFFCWRCPNRLSQFFASTLQIKVMWPGQLTSHVTHPSLWISTSPRRPLSKAVKLYWHLFHVKCPMCHPHYAIGARLSLYVIRLTWLGPISHLYYVVDVYTSWIRHHMSTFLLLHDLSPLFSLAEAYLCVQTCWWSVRSCRVYHKPVPLCTPLRINLLLLLHTSGLTAPQLLHRPTRPTRSLPASKSFVSRF